MANTIITTAVENLTAPIYDAIAFYGWTEEPQLAAEREDARQDRILAKLEALRARQAEAQGEILF